VAIYSSFLQRAFDQVIHDVALPNLNILFAIDRAGIVGEDGATHAGSFDLSFLRSIPNLVILAPSNENDCYSMLEAGFQHVGPVAVRYPRGGGAGEYTDKKFEVMAIGKAKIVREGQDIAILSFGALLSNCKKTAEKLAATLVDMRCVKPLDEDLLMQLAQTHKYFVTVEDNVVAGGAGSAVAEFVLNHKLNVQVKNLGLPDEFLPHGTRAEILAVAGLDEDNILQATTNFVATK
jgi:1-deoxy-D-xylulose-5-phosphate synthase